MQNDYSILNRRIDENGLSEASSPVHENAGFMAYNVLAGGVLTGKYLETPYAAARRTRTTCHVPLHIQITPPHIAREDVPRPSTHIP